MIKTKLSGISMDNPFILASGVLGVTASIMARVADVGCGAITTKSIGHEPKAGYPNPTVVELGDGNLINAMGLPNQGIELFSKEMESLKDAKTPIIGSIYGSSSEEFIKISTAMEDFGISAVELNLSCPHAKGYGLELGCDSEIVKEITATVKDVLSIPVFVKLSPNVTDIVKIGKAAEDANADAIVAINTLKAMKIDIDLKKPILSNKIGGYSGEAIKPIGVRCVYELAANLNIPIIGVGGILTGEDVIEYLMAGASAIQIGSGIYYRGCDIFRLVCTEIEEWMKKHQYQNISHLIGAVHS